MKKIIGKNPLFFAFLFPALVDGALTLLGQNADYWSHRIVNEASPAYYFLLASPWLFVAGAIIWYLFWYWVFRKIKEPLNLFLMFFFIAGHAWGSTSWVWNLAKRNGLYNPTNQLSVILTWSFVVIYFALIALFATYCLRVYFQKRKR